MKIKEQANRLFNLNKVQAQPIQRSSNLELYRILVMLLIMSHHYVVNSGLTEHINQSLDASSVFFWLFGMWGKPGINCFVMITGYFMCCSRITLRKFVKLVGEVIFWNFVCYTAFAITGYGHITAKAFFVHLLPVLGVKDNFMSCFILFWLTIPFLNILIHNLSRRQHLQLIALSLFIYTFLRHLPYSEVYMNYVSWFIVLYFIASYIRLYPEHIWRGESAKAWGWLTLVTVLLAMGSVVQRLVADRMAGRAFSPYWLVTDSNAVLALAVGVTSFIWFKNLHIPHSRFINAVGATTFGVFLIHTNGDVMRQWLWRDVVDCVGHVKVPHYYIYAPAAVICIFVVCCLLDWLRIHTVEKWGMSLYDQWEAKRKLS